MVKPRIAIIGAGSSGLAALKQCLDDDLDPICFEQTSSVGGLWNFVEIDDDENKDPHSSAYKSLVINTSKELMTFSDFPIPAEWPSYLPNSLVAKYFNMYADNFKLRPYIKFRTTVVNVSYLPDHRWRVKYINNENKSRTEENHSDEYEEIFDYVMVCNGHHRKHRWPKYKGMNEFKGEQIHSHFYRRSAPFENKRVVVVGIGNSGIDIAVELSHIASQVYLCIRKETLPWILPRLIDGKPIDHLANRFSSYYLPNSSSTLTKLFVQTVGPHPPSLKPTKPIFSSHPTLKSDFFERLNTGTIIVTKNILELMPDETKSIKFIDGSIVENIDVIIYATGYNIDFPFLDNEIVNGGSEIEQEFEEEYRENLAWMYKMIFPPKYHNIAFIGLIQPIGPIFPIAEMQSRYVTSLIKGLINPLPSPQDMNIAIKKHHQKIRNQYYLSARHTIQVDFLDHLDELSQELGCYPYSFEILRKYGFSILKLVLFGMRTPIQYRLLGRQSWDGAKNAIMIYNKIDPNIK